VVKTEDAMNCLTADERDIFFALLDEISEARKLAGKDNNEYVVVNRKEAYAEPIWDIIIAFETLKEQKQPEAARKGGE
jgi:hypothetical protein